jgi:uncharacterized protein (DUF924 family)
MNAASALPAPHEVLAFWFGEPPTPEARGEWFRKDEAFDTTIRIRFGPLIDTLLDPTAVLPDAWQQHDTATLLARIVVLDQFTRNAHRNTPRAFSGDAQAQAQAQALARRLRGSGADKTLTPLQRWFAFLPFEHAEDRAAQAESLAAFGDLATEHPAHADALDWAERHARIVERFGRYPHRNLVLGRVSTAEEVAFLKEPGSSF